MSSQPTQQPQPTQLELVESLVQHIDAFQSDLHAYVKKAEKVQEAAKKSSVIITIDGEEYFVESYQDKRIAVRFTDNHAYSSETGDFVGLWNEETRSLTEIPEDEDD